MVTVTFCPKWTKKRGSTSAPECWSAQTTLSLSAHGWLDDWMAECPAGDMTDMSTLYLGFLASSSCNIPYHRA